jgi:hypothetical protein
MNYEAYREQLKRIEGNWNKLDSEYLTELWKRVKFWILEDLESVVTNIIDDNEHFKPRIGDFIQKHKELKGKVNEKADLYRWYDELRPISHLPDILDKTEYMDGMWIVEHGSDKAGIPEKLHFEIEEIHMIYNFASKLKSKVWETICTANRLVEDRGKAVDNLINGILSKV